MAKIYRITIKDIQEIVREVFQRLPIVAEYYARSRRDVLTAMCNLLPQICVHWCLIYYAEMYGIGREYLNHWRRELGSFMTRVCPMTMKCDNGPNARLTVAQKAWETKMEGASFQTVKTDIYDKMGKEGMTDNAAIERTIEALLGNKNNIIMLLSLRTLSEVNQFVEQTTHFGNENNISQQGRNRRKRR